MQKINGYSQTKADALQKYEAVGNSLENALSAIEKIVLVGKMENHELTEIKKSLKSMSEEFRNEIENLAANSEWDKFCVAFFGETNAGKSTIIESLRIIYEEESRRNALAENKNAFQKDLSIHLQKLDELQQTLVQLNRSFADETKQEPAKPRRLIPQKKKH